MYLRTGESLQRFVVVAFVRAPGDPYHGACHAFERIVYRVDIGGLGIVDPQYAVGFPDGFEAVADGGEAVDRAADRGRRDACRKGCKSRGHGVIGIVQPFELHLGRVDLDRGLPDGRREFAVAEEGVAGTARHGILCGEGKLLHAQVVPGKLLPDHLVVARIDEIIARVLVLRDAHFRIDVVLETVSVAVEVVGRDVHQHADMGAEFIHAVQLERAELQHVPVVVARGHGVGETLADVAAQGGVQPGVAHDLVDERRGGGFAVRAGDADAFRPAQVTARELHFRNDGNACRTDFPHYGGRFGDPWRLDDLVCRKDAFLGVAAFLVGNLPLVELGFVAVGDLPHIGEEYVELFLFGEDRGAVTADASAQDCYLFHDYRIFNVTRVMAASSSEMIQKRSTILVSNCPFFWK